MSTEEEAPEEQTTVAAEPSEHAEEEFHPFDEFQEEFKPSAIRKVLGEDGLPTQVALQNKSDIPPLSPETLVCMGDYSDFVLRDKWGEVREVYQPHEVRQDLDGTWWVIGEPTCIVDPRRPPCMHYVRQITQLEANPEHQMHVRLCAARRTTEGTFMTLRDTAMWACSMRQPRDPVSEQHITRFDEQKVEEGKRRVSLSIFGQHKE